MKYVKLEVCLFELTRSKVFLWTLSGSKGFFFRSCSTWRDISKGGK